MKMFAKSKKQASARASRFALPAQAARATWTRIAVLGSILLAVAFAACLPMIAGAVGPIGGPETNLVNANFNSVNVGGNLNLASDGSISNLGGAVSILDDVNVKGYLDLENDYESIYGLSTKGDAAIFETSYNKGSALNALGGNRGIYAEVMGNGTQEAAYYGDGKTGYGIDVRGGEAGVYAESAKYAVYGKGDIYGAFGVYGDAYGGVGIFGNSNRGSGVRGRGFNAGGKGGNFYYQTDAVTTLKTNEVNLSTSGSAIEANGPVVINGNTTFNGKTSLKLLVSPKICTIYGCFCFGGVEFTDGAGKVQCLSIASN